MMRTALIVLVMAGTAAAQNHPKVDQRRVDEAIKKGVAYLRRCGFPPVQPNGNRTDELVIWTLVHAGVPEDDPWFAHLFKQMMERKLEKTYNTALQAMILEELNRVKYQPRLQDCGQYLIDNQCKNGQWQYGVPFPESVPTTGESKDVPTESAGKKQPPKEVPPGQRVKPKVVKTIEICRTREGPDTGDNSNSQYAALGLRACHDAGIIAPKDVAERAIEYFHTSQRNDGAWSYMGPALAGTGSMTAGAVGSLTIYHYILGAKAKKDKSVKRGMDWLDKNFTVKENPGCDASSASEPPNKRWYYYLYALERAGILYGTEYYGKNEWYPEGANMLLDKQREDGAWEGRSMTTCWDTCFAILFLRRACVPLPDVASGPRK